MPVPFSNARSSMERQNEKKKRTKKIYICVYFMFYLVEQWYTALWIKLKAGALSRWFIPRLGHFWIIHFDNEKQCNSRNLSSPVFITIDDCILNMIILRKPTPWYCCCCEALRCVSVRNFTCTIVRNVLNQRTSAHHHYYKNLTGHS